MLDELNDINAFFSEEFDENNTETDDETFGEEYDLEHYEDDAEEGGFDPLHQEGEEESLI